MPQGKSHDHDVITAAIDLGKYRCHWVLIGWRQGFTGNIIDYGVVEVPNVGVQTDAKSVELAIYGSLLQWREDLLQMEARPGLVLIDSGEYERTAYGFIREVAGNPFVVSKGMPASRFRHGQPSPRRIVGNHWFATYQQAEGLWLYLLDTDFWKQFVHERFATPTFSEAGEMNAGSLSLFASDDRRRHSSFAHHIVAEMREDTFTPGKGLKRQWVQVNRNNHWLDATYMASAAAAMLGIQLPMGTGATINHQRTRGKEAEKKQFTNPYGQPYLVTNRSS